MYNATDQTTEGTGCEAQGVGGIPESKGCKEGAVRGHAPILDKEGGGAGVDTCGDRRQKVGPRLCIPSEFCGIPTEFGQKSPAGTEYEQNKHRNVL